ncbi:hypothetical protein A6R71_18205 [Xanthomonas translucens pv. arrhenatheri]|nr:hypothetical protein A6R71_18205 [Xanthomonas translucens pv. arrhenatheri]
MSVPIRGSSIPIRDDQMRRSCLLTACPMLAASEVVGHGASASGQRGGARLALAYAAPGMGGQAVDTGLFKAMPGRHLDWP